MPRLFLPPDARALADGQAFLSAPGGTVREVLEAIDAQFPGVLARLTETNELRPGLVVVIGDQPSARGLSTRVAPDAEIHFLPPLGGG